jgi:hypothetical protein
VLNHDILLAKLDHYGIRGIANSWIKLYLIRWVQFFEIVHIESKSKKQKTYASTYRELKYGVPQRSALGPMLFLPYVNDLSLNVQDVKMVQFADDTNIFVIGKDMVELQHKIDRVMKQLEVWFFNNNHTINTEKTRVMFFHCNKRSSVDLQRIVLNKIELNYTSQWKFLGITITDNLNWSTHIQALSSNVSRALYIIKTSRGILSTSVLRNIYFAKFQSLLRYGIIF